MKKRYHTNQKNHKFSLNGSFSNRSHRGEVRLTPRGISQNLASEVKLEEKLAQNSIAPLADWQKEKEHEMKLEDELSKNELNGFAFSCIESLANLATKKNPDSAQSVDEVITKLVNEELITYTELARESKAAGIEFREYAAWSKKFITSVQSLLSDSNAPSQEVDQLSTQVMQCAERSLCQKYRSGALNKRVDFLVDAVASYVGNVGLEMGLPEAVMNKVAASVELALAKETVVVQ
jgi:hypothetical protein